jgi:hypothetical protein
MQPYEMAGLLASSLFQEHERYLLLLRELENVKSLRSTTKKRIDLIGELIELEGESVSDFAFHV